MQKKNPPSVIVAIHFYFRLQSYIIDLGFKGMPCAYVTGCNIINNFRNYRIVGFLFDLLVACNRMAWYLNAILYSFIFCTLFLCKMLINRGCL